LARPAFATGPGWALAGLAGWTEVDAVGPSGSAQEGSFRFLLSEILFSGKTNPKKCFKALKILKKSQKF
jgi:hypothetical protein